MLPRIDEPEIDAIVLVEKVVSRGPEKSPVSSSRGGCTLRRRLRAARFWDLANPTLPVGALQAALDAL